MDAMLPCPFCGCPDIDVRTRKTTIVECVGCGSMFINADRSKAIRRWNSRVFSGATIVSSVHLESIDPPEPGIDEQNA